MFLLLVAIGFVVYKSTDNKKPQRDYFVIKLIGKNLPTEIAVEKDTTIEQVLSTLAIYNTHVVKKIDKNTKEILSLYDKVTGD